LLQKPTKEYSCADGSALLIMREWDEGDAAALLESPAVADTLVAADVAAFVFDGSDAHSLRTAQRLLLRIATAAGDSLPCVLVATKDDAGMSQVRIAYAPWLASATEVFRAICNDFKRSYASLRGVSVEQYPGVCAKPVKGQAAQQR